MHWWCPTVIFSGCLLIIVYAGYDCRRFNTGCKNKGTCNLKKGTCDCNSAPGFDGYDCGLASSEICTDRTGSCLNGSICYQSTKCYCASGMVGDLCNESYAQVVCDSNNHQMLITIFLEPTFAGIIHKATERNCTLEPDDKNVLNQTLDLTSEEPGCMVPEKITENGTVFYQIQIVAQYNTEYITSLDAKFTIKCETDTKQRLFGTVSKVNLDDTTDLTEVETTDSLSSVVMSITDNNGDPLTDSLHVGQLFQLIFTLINTDVYNTLQITSCSANDTNINPEDIIVLEFLTDSCPTGIGASFIKGQQRAMTDANNNPLIMLLLAAFKFITSEVVGLNCTVKLCAPGDGSCAAAPCPGYDATSDVAVDNGNEVADNANDGNEVADNANDDTVADGDTGGAEAKDEAEPPAQPVKKRRKRETHHNEEQMTGAFTVTDPYSPKNDVQISGPGGEDCEQDMDFLALIIVMACAIFVLFVACFIMIIKIIRSRTKVHDTEIKSIPPGPQKFYIPRAKLCNDTSKI